MHDDKLEHILLGISELKFAMNSIINIQHHNIMRDYLNVQFIFIFNLFNIWRDYLNVQFTSTECCIENLVSLKNGNAYLYKHAPHLRHNHARYDCVLKI